MNRIAYKITYVDSKYKNQTFTKTDVIYTFSLKRAKDIEADALMCIIEEIKIEDN